MPPEHCPIRTTSTPQEGTRARRLVERLAQSTLFKEYQTAFRGATGLSLSLRPAQRFQNFSIDQNTERTALCQLVTQSKPGCESCQKLQADLERAAVDGPQSLNCFAGLSDSAVPVRVDGELIAFLHTGQVLLHPPNQEEFAQTKRQLLAWNVDVNLQAVEDAYFKVKVFDRQQYESILGLLEIFAQHLSMISRRFENEEAAPEPKLVTQAKQYIKGHYRGHISLDDAARAVNASPRHFCKVFKEHTGITFTDYLARVRVENTKRLLQNPHLRVSEIAFEAGFDSISQFNRSFKRITGQSPTQFRGA
jgi:AraC-like DNA-binding protein/ligand-binding sensor protein